MGEAQILAAKTEDVESVLAIQTVCGLSAWSRQDYVEEVGRNGSVFLVAREHGGPISGFIVGRVQGFRTSEGSGDADIYNIGVLPEFRRRGYGGELLNRFIERCRERDAPAIWLEVRTSNATAKNFYLSYGFKVMWGRPGFYSDPVEDADVMKLELREGRNFQSGQGA